MSSLALHAVRRGPLMGDRVPQPNDEHRALLERADKSLQKAEREIRETRRILDMVRAAGEFTEQFNRQQRPGST